MSWNEPGDKDTNQKNKERSPFGGQKDAPPDLDEAFKKMHAKLKRALGGNGSGGTGGSSSDDFNGAGVLFSLVLVVALVLWALSGIFIVGPAEQGVVLRFGKYFDTVDSGPHWIPRFIDKKIIKDVSRVQQFSYSSHMLTKDENIVSVSVAVHYKIGDLKNYLFNVSDPQESLRQATASALRQVVGHTTLDEIITGGREVWARSVEELLKEILVSYKAGIVVSSVSPQPARAPDQVQDAFDDAIKAQEDEKRFKEKARAYSEKVVPIAQGNAKRMIEAASAFAKQVVFAAKGDVAEFLALVPEYKAAPFVTGKRLYLDTMEKVLTATTKLLVEGNSGQMLYLPLDKLLSADVNSGKPHVKTIDEEVPSSQSPTVINQQANSRLSRNTYGGRRVYP